MLRYGRKPAIAATALPAVVGPLCMASAQSARCACKGILMKAMMCSCAQLHTPHTRTWSKPISAIHGNMKASCAMHVTACRHRIALPHAHASQTIRLVQRYMLPLTVAVYFAVLWSLAASSLGWALVLARSSYQRTLQRSHQLNSGAPWCRCVQPADLRSATAHQKKGSACCA